MAPETHRIVGFNFPVLFIDEKPAGSVFDLEARWGSNIKRSHHVVRVAAEAHCECQFFVVDNIEGSTDVGELLNFQHQVMEASDAGGSAQRQRVVTGVAVQEPQAQS